MPTYPADEALLAPDGITSMYVDDVLLEVCP